MEDSLITANGIRVGVSSRCMKGARIRSQQTGEFHFLTFSCCRRRSYSESAAAMELFEDALERVRRRSLFAVAGYVVIFAGVKGAWMSDCTRAGFWRGFAAHFVFRKTEKRFVARLKPCPCYKAVLIATFGLRTTRREGTPLRP